MPPTPPALRVAKTVAALAALQLTLPLDLAVTGAALLNRVMRPATRPPTRVTDGQPKTIMLSGGKMTKALALARSFHGAGHRVVLVESARYRFTGHRFSRAVDAFHTIPDCSDEGYAEALLAIVLAEGVDVYVPVCSPASSRHDAQAKTLLAAHCEVVHVDADVIAQLDDKHAFATTAASLGLAVPETHRITDPQQVLDFPFPAGPPRFILKSIPYDPVHRLDLTRLPLPTPAATEAFVRSLPIAADRPWILQEFLEGQEFCTHGTVRDGALQVWACCRSSAFQVNYAMAVEPEIEAWVRRFCKALGLTGQVSFDFIEGPDGTVRAIECNPRTHSAITMFHDHPDLARAYLEDDVPTLTPLPGSRPTYWLYHELWRILSAPSTALERLRVIAEGTDAIFDRDDPLPYLMVHHLHIPSLLLGNLLAGRDWIRIDFNIGKLVEPAGD